MNDLGKFLVISGLLLTAAGALVWFRQSLARAFAGRHSLFPRKFQFLFPDRHLLLGQRVVDGFDVAFQEIGRCLGPHPGSHQPSLRDSSRRPINPKVKNLGLFSTVPFGTERKATPAAEESFCNKRQVWLCKVSFRDQASVPKGQMQIAQCFSIGCAATMNESRRDGWIRGS